MMKRGLLTLILSIISLISFGQKVGVVFSGGGAKGLYHVGILRALEENNIPIDYISGTSMGAIVGALYSTGYSPQEMIKLFISDSVQTWLTGAIPEQYSYYFKKFEPTPEMVSVNFNVNKSDKKSNVIQLPVNIISPYRIDLAFMSMLQPGSWAAKENFDSLMVPYRCLASDVYNKKAITFKNGSLPFAVRSSMSIPFVFTPLQYDSVLLYDGGLYNNFPYQVMQEDFAPDVIIGGVCSTNDPNPGQDDLVGQIMVMITNPTDYSLPDSSDVLIRRKFKNVNTLEYSKAAHIMQLGYDDAIKQMPQIKRTIKRRVSTEEINSKRAAFKSKMKPLFFEQLTIEGLTDKQKGFVLRQLGISENQLFDPHYFEEKYMRILATGLFTGEFPEVTINPLTGFYKLRIKMATKPSLKISVGGNISSTSLNQLYLGLDYTNITNKASTYYARGYLGTFYNAVVFGGRHDIYTQFPFYLEYRLGYDNSNYDASNMNPYYKNRDYRFKNSTNFFLGASAATAVFNNWAIRGSLNLASNESSYFESLHNSQDIANKSEFISGELSFDLQARRANYTQYSIEGFNRYFGIRYIMGLESFRPGSISNIGLSKGKNRSWFVARAMSEDDFHINKWFNFGYLVDLVISNQPNFKSSIYTSFMAPSFSPTPHSTTLFMPEYRSSAYLGIGVSPIFKFTKKEDFYLKSYAYAFIPKEIFNSTNNLRWIFGGSFVYQTPIGPASFTVSKYTTGPNNWAFVLGFGYAIFNAQKIKF